MLGFKIALLISRRPIDETIDWSGYYAILKLSSCFRWKQINFACYSYIFSTRRSKHISTERLRRHRNIQNLVQMQYFHSSNIWLGVWNSQSIKKKSRSICDLVISNHLDVLAITETWLTGKSWNSTVAEILNTVKGYKFYDVSRVSRTGGGAGVFIQRGFRLSLFLHIYRVLKSWYFLWQLHFKTCHHL